MKLRLGIVADTRDTLNQLTAIVAPLQLTLVGSYTQLLTSDWKGRPADLWLVVSENVDDIFDALSAETDAPILMAESIPDRKSTQLYKKWSLNLTDKISEMMADITPSNLPAMSQQEFREVWVIIASIGGPEAVRTFFANVAKDIPVAFVYAQHIDANAAQHLLGIINHHSDLSAFYAETGAQLEAGKVAIIPPDKFTSVNQYGQFTVSETVPWQEPYTPNFDQVIQNIAQHYLYRLGVMVFSGMCDDGAHEAARVAELDAPLWAQNPDECVSSSMPESVIRTERVSFIGDAKNLADKLNERFGMPNE